GGYGGHGPAAGAVLRHQPRVLDEFAGDARFDQGAAGQRREDPTRRAAARGLIAGPRARESDAIWRRKRGAFPLPALGLLPLPACGERVGVRGSLQELGLWDVPLTRRAP